VSETSSAPTKRFLTNPWLWAVIIGGVILWAMTGFRPFGFPEGEYACTARSGVQEFPISVYHVEGQPKKVIEYRPGEAVDISAGMTYSHSMFDRHLNLYLRGETYRCDHVS